MPRPKQEEPSPVQEYMCPHCLEPSPSMTCPKCHHAAYPCHSDPLIDQFKDGLQNIINNISKNHAAVIDPNDMLDNFGAVEDLVDRATQVQPAGIDLTVGKISALEPGIGLEIDFTNAHRKLPGSIEIFSSGDVDLVAGDDGKVEFETDDGILLNASFESLQENAKKIGERDLRFLHNNLHAYEGFPCIAPYLVTYHEKVVVPSNMIGIVMHRSTLMRGFASLLSAVWEPGYAGYGNGIIYVPRNTIIHKFARVGQIIFLAVNAMKSYDGIYNNEGMNEENE